MGAKNTLAVVVTKVSYHSYQLEGLFNLMLAKFTLCDSTCPATILIQVTALLPYRNKDLHTVPSRSSHASASSCHAYFHCAPQATIPFTLLITTQFHQILLRLIMI